jgi:hypothetical protein
MNHGHKNRAYCDRQHKDRRNQTLMQYPSAPGTATSKFISVVGKTIKSVVLMMSDRKGLEKNFVS